MRKVKNVVKITEDTKIGNGIILEKGDKIEVLTEQYSSILQDPDVRKAHSLIINAAQKWTLAHDDNRYDYSEVEAAKDGAYKDLKAEFNNLLYEVGDLLS